VEFRNYPNASKQVKVKVKVKVSRNRPNIFWHFLLYTIKAKIFKSTRIKMLSVVFFLIQKTITKIFVFDIAQFIFLW